MSTNVYKLDDYLAKFWKGREIPSGITLTFDSFDDDYLMRTTTLTGPANHDSWFGSWSIQISPFPSCCGFRILHGSVMGSSHRSPISDIEWYQLVDVMLRIDWKFCSPSKYLFALPGHSEGKAFYPKENQELRVFTDHIMKYYHCKPVGGAVKNVIMDNKNRLHWIETRAENMENEELRDFWQIPAAFQGLCPEDAYNSVTEDEEDEENEVLVDSFDYD